jgi:hypothetical protein
LQVVIDQRDAGVFEGASPISCFGVVGFSLCPVARVLLSMTNAGGE